MKRRLAVMGDCLLKNRVALIFFVTMSLLQGLIFYLYGLSMEPFFYSEVLLAALLLFYLIIDYINELKKANTREDNLLNLVKSGYQKVEEGSLIDRDYQRMVEMLENELQQLRSDYAEALQQDDDYYTSWVHQIKTPIAVMKLELTADNKKNRTLQAELFRIEQYVEMVLDYGRLKSNSNDLLIKEYSLDGIIREVLHKFAQQFILKKIKLNYTPTSEKAITDKKWLSFILEQILSNALKYTQKGEIVILVSPHQIQIRDSGIGIAKEDIPRIFEKGYTGVNGRLGQKSSGLGLFLTKKAADLLSIRVSCDSEVSKGSTFTIALPYDPYAAKKN